MPTLILSILLSTVTFAADLRDEPFCYDEDKAFKACRDQNQIFAEARRAAMAGSRKILVVYGYEACPWSQSILKVLNFSVAAATLRAGAVVVPIAASKLDLSGRDLIAKLRREFAIEDAGEGGVPQLFVIDPARGLGAQIRLKPFERNTEKTERAPAYYGYDAGQILIALDEAVAKLTR